MRKQTVFLVCWFFTGSIVHFSDDEDSCSIENQIGSLHNHEIQPILVETIEDQRDKSFSVYFGILQEGFEYSLDVKIPIEDLIGYLKLDDVLKVSKMPKLASVPNCLCTAGFLRLVLELPVARGGEWNGLFEDFIRLHSAENPKWTISIKFSAKILRK